MRYGITVLGVACLVLAEAWSPPVGPEGAAAVVRATGAAGQEPGRAIFVGKGNCFTCHGGEATGTPLAPDLTDDEWVNFDERPTDEQMRTLVKEGVDRPVRYPAPMPPMGGGALSDDEIAAVATYVLGLSSPGS